MAEVLELVTVADLREDDAGRRRISVSVRQEAVLDDGRRVVLVDGRGWASELRGAGAAEVPDIWTTTTEAEIARQARVVVGPDEPFAGRSHEAMAREHWQALAAVVRAHGVAVDGEQLRSLPDRVELGPALLARLRPAGFPQP